MGIPHTLIKFCLPKTVKMAGYSTMAIVTRQSRFWKKCFFWCILFSDKFVARNQWVWCESFQRWIPNPTIWHLDFVSVVDFLTYLYIQYSKQVILLFKKNWIHNLECLHLTPLEISVGKNFKQKNVQHKTFAPQHPVVTNDEWRLRLRHQPIQRLAFLRWGNPVSSWGIEWLPHLKLKQCLGKDWLLT